MNEILETDRLLMRRFREEDAEGMFKLNSDPDVIRYTGDAPFSSVDEARSFIRQYDTYEKFGYGRFTVLLKGTGEYVGWCGLKYDAGTGETDLGFRLLQEHWNKGYATESSLRSLDFGFRQLKLQKITGRAMIENKPSIQVLKKVGMKFEKEFEAHGGICVQYFITRNEESD